MEKPALSKGNEQRLLKNARREGLLILAAWAIALAWSVIVGYLFGYYDPQTGLNAVGRKIADMTFVLGMPDWVFWGVVFPWVLCFGFSTWFCFGYMADDDLGQDPAEGADHG